MKAAAAVLWVAPGIEAGIRPAEPDPEQTARIERARLVELAHQEGYQAGHAKGLAEGRVAGHDAGFADGQLEVRRLAAQIEGILHGFSRPLARLDSEVGDALGEVAVRVAGCLLGYEYRSNPTLLAELVQEAMLAVDDSERGIELRLHPDDRGILTPYLATISGVRLVDDPALARGDLRLHSESVRINGSLDARLELCLNALLSNSSGSSQ